MSDQLTGIHHGLPNDTYRDAPGLSATFLKGCIRSVKHAMTPKPRSKSLDTGLRVHEFILEREKFLNTYVQEPNQDDYPGALCSSDDLREAINELNESRKPLIKTTGSRDDLLQSLMQDDPHHFDGVQDIDKLTISDLKKQIKFVNSNPNRGMLSTGGTINQMIQRLRDAGYDGAIWPDILNQFRSDNEGKHPIPYAEYQRYEDIYKSLINHLDIGAQRGDTLFAWLLAAFTGIADIETEVSYFAGGSKCRLDGRFMAGDKRVGIELKSTSDATPDAFTRQCCRLHYDLAHEHYMNTCSGTSEPIDIMVFIAVETEAPFGVSVLTADEEFRLTGQKKLAYAKRKYKEYCSRERNAVYSPTVKTVTSPLWNTCGPWENEPTED